MHENNRLTAKTSRILLRAEFINLKQKQEFDIVAEKNLVFESERQRPQIIGKKKDKRLEYKAVKKEGD